MLAAARLAADLPGPRVSHAAVEWDLRTLGRRRVRRTRTAARRLIGLLGDFAARGATPLAEALGTDAPRAWEQYAHGSVDMRRTGELFYYYHSHGRVTPGEHGHFHLFKALAAGDRGGRDRYAHLVAIGVDARGMPRRLFTTNRWVTGEAWIEAREAALALERIATADPPDAVPVERWLRGLIAIFMPQINMLLERRDQRVGVRGGANVLEDRRMRVLSECTVSLTAQVAAIDSAFQ